MLKPILWDYKDAYIHVKRTMTVPNTTAAVAAANGIRKRVIFKNFSPFTDFISEISNKQVDHGKDIDVAMPINYLI